MTAVEEEWDFPSTCWPHLHSYLSLGGQGRGSVGTGKGPGQGSSAGQRLHWAVDLLHNREQS